MNFVFWQNIISPHQAPFLRALAENGHEVTVIASEVMTADRLALGWHTPDLGRAKIIIDPDKKGVRQIVSSSPVEAVHVLAGARWTPLGQEATESCLSLHRNMGVMSESPDPRGLAGLARHLKYTAERFTKGRHYDFVLAMGEKGVRWFHQCGYPSARLFPFAYVTEGTMTNDDLHAPSSMLPAGEVSILFVGQLVPRKGVDLLLRAFALTQMPGIKLQLVGYGPEESELRRLAQASGISNLVGWMGKKSSAEIPVLMAGADVVVLPSREDGWGAVVNEALMAGTPVLCSTACGAAELIRHPWLGAVFRSGNITELAAALQQWSIQGRRTLGNANAFSVGPDALEALACRIILWPSCPMFTMAHRVPPHRGEHE